MNILKVGSMFVNYYLGKKGLHAQRRVPYEYKQCAIKMNGCTDSARDACVEDNT